MTRGEKLGKKNVNKLHIAVGYKAGVFLWTEIGNEPSHNEKAVVLKGSRGCVKITSNGSI